MADKAYCEGKIRHLVWLVAALTVVIVAGSLIVRKNAQANSQSNPQGLAGQAALTYDGITKATPKGGVKLANNVTAQRPANLAAATLPAESIQELMSNVAANVKPSVVHIEITRPDPLGGSVRMEGIGSGVIVDRRGYVLTNYHVMDRALSISITTYSKAGPMVYDGKLVHSDARSDLAVVRILGATDFPTAKLGSVASLDVGDWVLAIGSPLDLAQTVSFGIVSALRETVQIGGISYLDMIQTDAHINKGNSGGPLVNIYGEVIGINTAIYTPNGAFTGVGFAIPADHAKALLDELNIAPQRFTGVVANLNKPGNMAFKKGSWLGVEGISLDPDTTIKYGVSMDQGVYVTGVFVNSPAHYAGLRRGDVLFTYDGAPVANVDGLRTALSRTAPGKRVMLKASRTGAVLNLEATTSPKW